LQNGFTAIGTKTGSFILPGIAAFGKNIFQVVVGEPRSWLGYAIGAFSAGLHCCGMCKVIQLAEHFCTFLQK
jgi:hypothetical protein